MSGLLDGIKSLIGSGWNPDVPTEGIRPDYGLSTAQFQPMQKSQYEPTLESSETRSLEDFRSMLAELILAGGAGASPVTGPRGIELARTAARSIPRNIETPLGAGVTQKTDGGIVVSDATSGARLYNLKPSEFRANRRTGTFRRSDLGRDIDVYHGTTAAKIRPEPGLHVGTPEQANYRAMMGSDPITREVREGAKVFPLKMTPRKMVDINDLGNAMSFPGNKAAELLRVGAITKAEHDAVLRSPSSTKALNDLLLAKKIDALRYGNQWEGEGKSYEVLNPKILRGAYQR